MGDNNDHNSSAAFSQGHQSNPFSNELKGEFSSDFGTSTNAVSQIFKGNGFGAENKGRLVLLGILLLAVAGGLYFYLAEPGIESEAPEVAESGETPEDAETTAEAPLAPEAAKPEEAAKPAEAAAPSEAPVTASAPAVPQGAVSLISPPPGAKQAYDETGGPTEFRWEGPADQIVFSRSASMNPVVRSVKLSGANSFAFENPYPGTWFWQVKNASGESEVRSFVIEAPPRRVFPIAQPQSGGSLAGNGGVVSWQAGEKIARYSVELVPSGQAFTNATYRFGTSGTSITLQGVNPGTYDVRVGAFSEVAGRWEWQLVERVSIQ